MNTRVDECGRIVIPKPVRIHLGLRTGIVLTIEERDHELRLRPVREAPSLALKEGLTVFVGTEPPGISGGPFAPIATPACATWRRE